MKKGLKTTNSSISRRRFLVSGTLAALGYLSGSAGVLLTGCGNRQSAETFVAKVQRYEDDISSAILGGLRELRITEREIGGKRIFLKPNLVEPHKKAAHINTHPLVINGAIEAFRKLGASTIIVGEGPGHVRDIHLVLENSGIGDVLSHNRVAFRDLNNDEWYSVPNAARATTMKSLIFPACLKQVDWIVSMPKLKTHHWEGVTLSMKNLFGVMPGIFYGWPKNVLHWEGIPESIIDITATLRPDFAIADGVVGMEGDGPIMGKPKHAGVIVMGRNLTAVDGTCARIMGIDPRKVGYLRIAGKHLGPIRESEILQRGETVASVRTPFELVDSIPALRSLK